MILRTTDPDEVELRAHLAKILGDEDEATIAGFVWDNHHGSGVMYLDALGLICREVARNGKDFANRLLEVARKPKHVREAEVELHHWWAIRSKRAVDKVNAVRPADRVQAAKDAIDEIGAALIEKLRSMYPAKHRATVKGAVLSSFNPDSAKTPHLLIPRLVKTLNMDDPLAEGAAASWAVDDATSIRMTG